MQKIENIVLERSPVEVSLFVDGKLIHRRVHKPRGLRRDSSIYVYEEFLLEPGYHNIKLTIVETRNPQRREEIKFTGRIWPGETLAISYSELKGFFVIGGDQERI